MDRSADHDDGSDNDDVEMRPLASGRAAPGAARPSVLPYLLNHTYAQLLLLVVAASTLGTTSLILTAEAHSQVLFAVATTLLLGDVAEALVFGMFHFPHDSARRRFPTSNSTWNLSLCDYHPFFVFLLLQFLVGIVALVAAVLSDRSTAFPSAVVLALVIGTLTVGALVLLLLTSRRRREAECRAYEQLAPDGDGAASDSHA